MTTCMLEAKDLDANICSKEMNVVAYIQNKIPHSSMKGKTPFEADFGQNPDVSNFIVFESTAIRGDFNSKWAS